MTLLINVNVRNKRTGTRPFLKLDRGTLDAKTATAARRTRPDLREVEKKTSTARIIYKSTLTLGLKAVTGIYGPDMKATACMRAC
jgi:hypothetical protein